MRRCDGGFLVGIVSWEYGYTLEKYPGVCTRLSGLSDWLMSHLCEYSRNEFEACTSTSPTTSTSRSSKNSHSRSKSIKRRKQGKSRYTKASTKTSSKRKSYEWSKKQGGSRYTKTSTKTSSKRLKSSKQSKCQSRKSDSA